MRIINNLSVKARLILVLVLIIIFGIIMASFSIYQIGRMASMLQEVEEHSLKVSNASVLADLYIVKNRALIKDILQSSDQLKAVTQKTSVEENQKAILGYLDVVRDNITGKKGQNLGKDTRKLCSEWMDLWQQEWYLISKGNSEEALKMYNNQGKEKAAELEAKTEQLMQYSLKQADQFVSDANSSRTSSTYLLLLCFSIGTIVFTIFTMLISNSIISAITALKQTMKKSTQEGKLTEADVYGHNEITDMAGDFNSLIRVLLRNNWINDGKSGLRAITGDIMKIDDFVDKTLSFIAEYTRAGSAAFYTYREQDACLRLAESYAHTERDQNVCKPGEGIVGQVAKERKPILLKNVKRSEAVISSGTVSIQPLSVYAFPLKYNNNFLGVIEILFPNEISNRYIELLDELSRIISTALNNNIQNDRIRMLLEETERAKAELQQQSEALQKANINLEEQQQILSQQSEELQQANTQMEEQQQELQQMNVQLEEQKDALVKQNLILGEKNRQLDSVNQELDIRSGELEDANKYKSELLANMSHELRTPLNSIILLSRLLTGKKDNVFDEKEIEKVRVIHKSGVELLRLIDDILDLSKIEAGKMQIHELEFQTSELAAEWNDMFIDIAEEKQLQFTVNDSINARLYGDRDKLSQIIRNFMSNAFKFTKEGFIEVSMEENQSIEFPYQITVRDTGIGIPADKQSMIFDAFSQANSSITREFGGTGLGLSICKEMARLIGAKIHVNSEEGKGSEFILLLPVKMGKTQKPENREKLKRGNDSTIIPLTDDRRSIRKSDKVILVIEDDSDFAKIIMEAARELGFKVLLAFNGQTGLEMAKKFTPMGILLDLMLPDISGSKLLSVLKSEKVLSTIPVHIISGTEQDLELRKLGAIGFATKPLSMEDIKEALEKLVQYSLKSLKQVLLVEDDEVQSMAVNELLKAEDIIIKTAEDEETAVQELQKGGLDAVIIDLMLKNGNGLNICKFINEQNIEIPVIVYPARSLNFEQEQELRKYSDSIILKTASSQERLMDEVRMFLHKVMDYKKSVPALKDKLIEEQSRELTGKKILIVDDDAKNVFVLAAALEKLEVEIGNAHNGQEAIDKLKQERYDLVLMDIMMPVMDGYEAIRQMKANDRMNRIPIIALTAKALKGDKEKALEAGADDYISKPVDYNILIRLVHAWINKRAEG